MMTEHNDKYQYLSDLLMLMLNGRANQEHYALLNEMLRQSEANRRIYVEFMTTYVGLNYPDGAFNFQNEGDVLDFDSGVWQSLAKEEKTAPAITLPKEEAPSELIQKVVHEKVPRKLDRLSVYTVIVSMAAILLLVLMVKLNPVSPNLPLATVATLTDSINATWAEMDYSLNDEILEQDELVLEKGFAELTFGMGAKVMLEAPCRITLNNNNQMYLHAGKLSAHVPPEAYGFTVDTPDASIKDIGTEFGVDVQEGEHSEVHVFKGGIVLWACQEEKEKRSLKAQTLLEENQASRVATGSGVIKTIGFDSDGFIRSREEAIYNIHPTGAIQYLRTLPNSLQMDEFESDAYMRLFLERKRVLLENDVAVAFPGSGVLRPDRLSRDDHHVIPAGTKVDSYLLHYDRKHAEMGVLVKVTGSVTFTRPIVGLIVSYEQLEMTDSLFGNPDILYPIDKSRGLTGEDSKSPINDVITISDDRKRLDVFLTVANIDQIRVLVSAPQNDHSF